MAVPTPCTYKTVTLTPDEQFTLPPGAEIVSASDINSISSTCPIPTNLETPSCYGIVIAAHQDSTGGTEVWVGPGDDNIIFTGVYLNDLFYSFSSPILYNGTNIITALQNLPFGPAMTDFCTSSEDDLGNDSRKTYIIFNTVPSIADNMQLYGYTKGPNVGGGSGFGNVYFSHPVQLRSFIISQGHANVCNCPVI